ncbi:hypothetical protein N9L02_00185 [Gammaproteobacteria bacterium]|nr:hypothetical protein [Gammaproteobacteria bacterium]
MLRCSANNNHNQYFDNISKEQSESIISYLESEKLNRTKTGAKLESVKKTPIKSPYKNASNKIKVNSNSEALANIIIKSIDDLISEIKFIEKNKFKISKNTEPKENPKTKSSYSSKICSGFFKRKDVRKKAIIASTVIALSASAYLVNKLT